MSNSLKEKQKEAIANHLIEKQKRYRYDKSLLKFYTGAFSLDVVFTTGLRENENDSFFKNVVLKFKSANSELKDNWNDLTPQIVNKLKNIIEELQLDSVTRMNQSKDHLWMLFIDEINSKKYPYLKDDIELLIHEYYNGQIRTHWDDLKSLIAAKEVTQDSETKRVGFDRNVDKYLNINLRDNKGWEYAFKTKEDFENFKNILVEYLLYQTIPENIEIKLKQGRMACVASALNNIHDLTDAPDLKHDDDFYEIARVLEPFKQKTKQYIYKKMIH